MFCATFAKRLTSVVRMIWNEGKRERYKNKSDVGPLDWCFDAAWLFAGCCCLLGGCLYTYIYIHTYLPASVSRHVNTKAKEVRHCDLNSTTRPSIRFITLHHTANRPLFYHRLHHSKPLSSPPLVATPNLSAQAHTHTHTHRSTVLPPPPQQHTQR